MVIKQQCFILGNVSSHFNKKILDHLVVGRGRKRLLSLYAKTRKNMFWHSSFSKWNRSQVTTASTGRVAFPATALTPPAMLSNSSPKMFSSLLTFSPLLLHYPSFTSSIKLPKCLWQGVKVFYSVGMSRKTHHPLYNCFYFPRGKHIAIATWPRQIIKDFGDSLLLQTLHLALLRCTCPHVNS